MLQQIKALFTGFLAKLILIILTLGFVFIGFYGYNSPEAGTVAVVGGEVISPQKYSQEYEQMIQRQNINIQDLDDQQLGALKYAALQNLISRKLYLDALDKYKFHPDDDRVLEALVSNPEFQTDKKFNKSKLEAFLRNESLRLPEYEKRIRDGLAFSDFDIFLRQSLGLDSTEISRQLLADSQRKYSISFVEFSPQMIENKLRPNESQISEHYEANKSSYMTTTSYDLDIVRFDASDILDQVNVNEAEIARYFQKNSEQYMHPPEYQMRRIFLPRRYYSKSTAERILDRANKEPEKFDDFVRQYSIDAELKETEGMMPMMRLGSAPDYDGTAMSVQEGQVSDQLIELDDAYIIVKLINTRESAPMTLEDAKPQVTEQVKREKAKKRLPLYREKLKKDILKGDDNFQDYDFKDTFAKMDKSIFSEEKFDQSKPLASRFNARSFYFALQGKPDGQKGVYDFEDGSFVFYHLLKVYEPRQKELVEVRDEIKEILINEAALAKAKDLYTEQEAKVTDSASYEAMLKQLGKKVEATPTSFTKPGEFIPLIGQAPELKKKLLELKQADIGMIVKGTFGNRNFIIRFDGLIAPEETEETKAQNVKIVEEFTARINALFYQDIQSKIIDLEKSEQEVEYNFTTMKALGIIAPQ